MAHSPRQIDTPKVFKRFGLGKRGFHFEGPEKTVKNSGFFN
jgi:hypothetical protein